MAGWINPCLGWFMLLALESRRLLWLEHGPKLKEPPMRDDHGRGLWEKTGNGFTWSRVLKSGHLLWPRTGKFPQCQKSQYFQQHPLHLIVWPSCHEKASLAAWTTFSLLLLNYNVQTTHRSLQGSFICTNKRPYKNACKSQNQKENRSSWTSRWPVPVWPANIYVSLHSGRAMIVIRCS